MQSRYAEKIRSIDRPNRTRRADKISKSGEIRGGYSSVSDIQFVRNWQFPRGREEMMDQNQLRLILTRSDAGGTKKI